MGGHAVHSPVTLASEPSILSHLPHCPDSMATKAKTCKTERSLSCVDLPKEVGAALGRDSSHRALYFIEQWALLSVFPYFVCRQGRRTKCVLYAAVEKLAQLVLTDTKSMIVQHLATC